MSRYETTFKRGHELSVGDRVMSLGKPRLVESFDDYDPTRAGLPSEGGWRIANDGLGWRMTIEPAGHYYVIVSLSGPA